MPNQIMVKKLVLTGTEKVACDYCIKPVQRKAVMIRVLTEEGRLNDLALFCDHGCAFAYAREHSDHITYREATA